MTRRRRFAAGFAALVALTGTLVFGGAIAAQADDGLEIDETPVVYTGTAIPVVVGTASNANLGPVHVFFGTPATPGGDICGGVTPNPSTGAWSCTSFLTPGTYTVTAEQTAPNRVDTATITILPPAPAYTSPDPLTVEYGDATSFTGTTTAPAASIEVSIDGDAICTLGPYPTSGTAWSCPFDTTSTPGPDSYAITAVQEVNGLFSAPAGGQLEVTDPTSVFFDPALAGADIVWSSTPFVISGTTDNLAEQIYVTSDSVAICDATPALDGTWSCAPTESLAPGSYTLDAEQYPYSANVSLDVLIPAPTVTSGDPLEVPHGGTASITGTSTFSGGLIHATIPALGAGYECFATVTLDAWEGCDIEFDAEPGATYQVEVVQEWNGAPSQAPTTFTLALGQAPPPAPVIDDPTDGSSLTWSDGDYVSIVGRALATAPLDVELDGVVVCDDITPTYDTVFACNFSADIGSHTIVAVQGAAESAPVGITVEYAAPNVTTSATNTAPVGGEALYEGVATYDGVTVVVTTVPFFASCTIDTPLAVGETWQCPLSTQTASPGAYDVSVVQRLGATTVGDAWEGTLQLTDTILITSPADGAEVVWSDAGLDITGTTPSTADPIWVYLDGEFPVCNIVAPTANWSCPDVDIEPGAHFLVAQQDGYPDNQVDIVVNLPDPDVAQTGYSYEAGTTSAFFSGASTYAGADVHVDIEIGDSSYIGCDDLSGAGGWSCSIPIATLEPGVYNVFFDQDIEGTASSGVVTRSLEITAPGALPPPPLNCTFAPAGITISSPYQVVKSVYRLTPYEGGGFGGGGGEGEPYELAAQGYCNGEDGYHDEAVTAWNDGGGTIEGGDCGTAVCTLTDLDPGIYEVYHWLSDGDETAVGYSFEEFDYLFRIPETPGENAVASTTNSVLLSGTGTVGDGIRVERANGTALCSTTVEAGGTWACVFPKSDDASARTIAIDPQSGGLSAYTAFRAIPVFVAPVVPPTTPTPGPTPTPLPTLAPETPPTLVQWLLTFGGDLSNLKPGDRFSLNVSGMPEGTEIEVWMHSTPRLIGTATGTGLPMQLELTVPEDIESGPHEIEMIGVTPLGTHYFFTSDAMVVGGVEPGEPTTDEPTTDETDGSGGAADRTDPAAPSALSDGLAPLSAIVANPATIAIAGGLALALLFLVALPTELLNSSLSSNTSRLGRAYGAVDGALTKAQDWFISVTRSRAIAAIILTTIVAIIYGFVDPNFGFDVVSLRLVLSLAIAFFLLSFVASWISGMIIRRAWGAMGVVAMQPSIILFAVVGVIVARVLDFSPGFLVGVAIGLELLQASKTVSAKAVFVQLGVVTGLALAAWVVYSFFTPGNDFFGMLLEDTLVATTAEGLTGALIAVFPLKFLDGRELWEVSKRLWVAAFLIVSVAFALLVLPTAIEGTDVGDYGIWLLVFAVFGLGSLAVWLIFVRADAKAARAEGEKVDA